MSMRVTIKYVNHPTKPTAKYGNVKTTDDQTIMVPVANMNAFQRGMTCDLATEVTTWGSGPDARPVTIAVGLPGQGATVQSNPAPTGNIVQLSQPPAPEKPVGPAGGYMGRGNPDARMIFATGVVGRAMGSGKFEASQIGILLEEALRCYDKEMP
jgi:hypothetical protein